MLLFQIRLKTFVFFLFQLFVLFLLQYPGASIVGLGEKVGALYSPNESLLRDLQQAAARSGEKVWHMPLEGEYRSSIKGSITDLLNLSKAKGGGSITAALFLQEFVEKTPWAHLGTYRFFFYQYPIDNSAIFNHRFSIFRFIAHITDSVCRGCCADMAGKSRH